jgi:hypothetical protein
MKYESPTLRKSTLLFVLSLFLFFLPALAQNAEDSLPNRSIVVNVFDAHGSSVRDLSPANFRLFVNGKTVAINAASVDENGMPRKDLVISYPRYLFPPG